MNYAQLGLSDKSRAIIWCHVTPSVCTDKVSMIIIAGPDVTVSWIAAALMRGNWGPTI